MSPSPSALASSLELLRETFEGPAGPSTYFIDNDPKAGFFGALDGVTAAQASRPTRPGGATIAGHVFHAGFHLDMSTAWLDGDRADRDWAKSWELGTVDDAAWTALRRQFRGQYEAFQRAVAREPEDGGESFPTILGAIAHAAYHLGAVKQALAGAEGLSSSS